MRSAINWAFFFGETMKAPMQTKAIAHVFRHHSLMKSCKHKSWKDAGLPIARCTKRFIGDTEKRVNFHGEKRVYENSMHTNGVRQLNQ
jgi:hypothetical protein